MLRRTAYDACTGRKGRESTCQREYGKTEVMVDNTSPLFGDVASTTICWMSHFDYISKTAPGFRISAHTADCPVAAAENCDKKLFAIQFHPEITPYTGRYEDAP